MACMESDWTIAKAQAALGDAASRLRAVAELLRMVYRNVPRPPALADREEHRIPYDVATDVLGTLECVLEAELPDTIRKLERSSQITDGELAEEFNKREARYGGF
jgi:hypothetical protein